MSPLHDAARQGHLGTVRILVEYGASLSLQDRVSVVLIEWLYTCVCVCDVCVMCVHVFVCACACLLTHTSIDFSVLDEFSVSV